VRRQPCCRPARHQGRRAARAPAHVAERLRDLLPATTTPTSTCSTCRRTLVLGVRVDRTRHAAPRCTSTRPASCSRWSTSCAHARTAARRTARVG
jgi:hypothetical protein